MSIEVIEGDVLSFNFVSVVSEGVESVEYFDFPCVGWYGLVCVVICLEKIVWEVEISFVAANVVVSPRLDLFLCETGIPTVDKEATYLYVVSDDGGNELGVVAVGGFGGLVFLYVAFVVDAIVVVFVFRCVAFVKIFVKNFDGEIILDTIFSLLFILLSLVMLLLLLMMMMMMIYLLLSAGLLVLLN